MFRIFEKRLPQNAHTEKLLEKIRETADLFKNTEIVDLSFSNYKGFFDDGNRVPYEDEYIEHRKRLNSFLFLCLNGEDYISELEDSIWAVCNEFTWVLPSHLKGVSISDAPYMIDLFSAETAITLIELLSLTEDRINSMVADRIRYEVKRRITEPYLKGKKIQPFKNNWDSVRACGIGATLLYLYDDEDIEKNIPELLLLMESFLESYDMDGCCKEGPLYWEYGFGYFCYFADLLCKYTKGKIDLFEHEKVHNIALYRQKIMLNKDEVIPFSDSTHNYTFYVGLSDYLASKYDDVISIPVEYETIFGDDFRYRTAPLLRSFYWYTDEVKRGNVLNGVQVFEESMQYVYRKEKFVLAVKGGNNDEPHNHNDLGSFIIYADEDGFLFDDAGWPDYDDKYFSAERYDNICASSLGHSTLIIGGREQLTGVEATTKTDFFTNNSVQLDLSNVYGVNAIRKFEVADHTVTILDRVDTDLSVVQRFVTRIEPNVIEGETVYIGNVKIHMNGVKFAGVSTSQFKPRLNIYKSAMKEIETLYLIDFIPDNPHNEFGISVEF